MYHSVTIGSKNTFTDWHLVPDSRPVINMPEPYTDFVEIPGMSGTLDLSETLTGYPTYKNREGELKFHVLNGYNWIDIYSSIAAYIHGKRLKLVLEDDPNWYYEGRFSVKEWESNNDGTWSDITIGYNLDPYKLFNTASNEYIPADNSKPINSSNLVVTNTNIYSFTNYVNIYAPTVGSLTQEPIVHDRGIIKPIDLQIKIQTKPVKFRFIIYTDSSSYGSSSRVDYTSSGFLPVGTHLLSENGVNPFISMSYDTKIVINYAVENASNSATVTTIFREGAL